VLLGIATLSDLRSEAAAPVSGDALWKMMLREYSLFFRLDLRAGTMSDTDLLKGGETGEEKWPLPCAYADFLQAVANRYVRPAWSAEFLSAFSLGNLKKMAAEKKQLFRRSFASDSGTYRMDVFLPEEGEQLCYLGVCALEREDGNQLILPREDGGQAQAALADLRLEMQMVQDETRKKHRRNSFWGSLFAIVLGLTGGALLDQRVPAVSAFLASCFPAPAAEEEAPAEEASASAEEVSVPDPVKTYQPCGSPLTFTAEIMENGTSRTNTSSENYTALSFTASVKTVLDPEWFAGKYGRTTFLDGSESAVEWVISYAEAEDGPSSVIPQEAFSISVLDRNFAPLQGYQLMDAALGGQYRVAVSPGKDTTLYKRYEGDARYLQLICYQDGVPHEIYFALRYDDPNITYEEMSQGSRGVFVKAMKQKLAALGYLTAGQANSDFFDPATAGAVKEAQKTFGQEETGVADAAFLQRLYTEGWE